jgi:hypothetical protein
MLLLNSLNKTTYNQIKKDREILLDRMKSSQALLDEFDLVYPILDSVFNPKIKIRTSGVKERLVYVGELDILQPNNEEPARIVFSLGKADKYKGKDDKLLIIDAEKEAQKRIKDMFPEYFR